MANRWVCKPDGSRQCQQIAGIGLDEMRRQLAGIVGEDNILSQAKRHRVVPHLCGLPTGALNAYELTEDGYYILVHGYRGREGFGDCRGDTGETSPATAKPATDFADILAASGATSVAAHPVLVRELIGHVVRVYEVGDAITKDFIDGRANIVTLEGLIADIWFGRRIALRFTCDCSDVTYLRHLPGTSTRRASSWRE